MNVEVAKVVADAVQVASPNVLIVDDGGARISGAASLSDLRLEPEEMWALPSTKNLKLAVVAKPRTAAELYRILSLLERLVLPGGSILILPYAPVENEAAETRFEATEIFLGVYPEWTRNLEGGNVVRLRRQAEQKVEVTVPKVATVSRSRTPAVPLVSKNKRVVSLAVWGTGGYWRYLGAFVRAHHTLFPGYELRIHHDDDIYRSPYGGALHGLHARGLVKLVLMPSRPGIGKCAKMIWRLAPAWDVSVEYVFSRDLDALPTWRERRATEEFLISASRSETEAWTIHDSLSHAGMMGGLCGFRAASLRALAPTFEDFVAGAAFDDVRWNTHGADQDYLNGKVVLGMKVFEHSIFRWFEEDGVTRRYRNATDWSNAGVRNQSVRFATEIAPAQSWLEEMIPQVVRENSDSLINHLGSAGYDHERAIAFYNVHCPLAKEIQEAEREAGETHSGEKYA